MTETNKRKLNTHWQKYNVAYATILFMVVSVVLIVLEHKEIIS